MNHLKENKDLIVLPPPGARGKRAVYEQAFNRMSRLRPFIILLILSFWSLGALMAQSPCASVTAEAFPMEPQTGMFNYFGVRVSLPQPYNQDVTVTGTIHSDADPGSYPVEIFTLTIPAGSLSAETSAMYYRMDPTGSAAASIDMVDPCPVFDITGTYAGVTITYELGDHILRFNSASDFNTVLDRLELEYDNYNDNYDSQYPNLTSEQLDDMDAQNNFDEFRPYKDFEGLFGGFTSKRSEIESLENAWVNSDFTSADPDDVDLTFDDALNTIFNSDNSFKIGSDVYQLTETGLYINGVYQASVRSPFHQDMADFADFRSGGSLYSNALFQTNGNPYLGPSCQTNKKKKIFPDPIGNDKYKLKIAITSVGVHSGTRFKVKHYALKNGHWKVARTKMAVYLIGSVRNPSCNALESYNERKPAPNGWKNRRQLKIHEEDWGVVWKAYPNDLGGSFETASGHTGSLLLTW